MIMGMALCEVVHEKKGISRTQLNESCSGESDKVEAQKVATKKME